jgi:hypothetical protein
MEASIQNRSGSGDGNLSPDDSKFGAAGEALATVKKKILLDEKRVELGPDEIGGRPRHRDWAMQVDPAARLVWPVLPFNPYCNAPETDLRYAVGMLPAPVQHTAVDVSSAPHAMTRTYAGVSDRSSQHSKSARDWPGWASVRPLAGRHEQVTSRGDGRIYENAPGDPRHARAADGELLVKLPCESALSRAI